MEQNSEQLRQFYRTMLLCRRFEERVAQSYVQEKIRGFCHLYIGQEAVGVGTILAAREDDYVISTYREHAQALVKGCPPTEVMAELYGKVTGSSRGFGGSMHIFDEARAFMGGHGIVGGHSALALGLAFAARYQNRDQVTLCFLGDAAVNQGVFHESLNLASLWKLPVVFIIENNLYGMGTATNRALAGDVVKRGEMYDIPSRSVDGMDVLEVYHHTREAVERAREEGGPSFIEARCYRFKGHSMSDPQTYRSREEIQREQQRDPINRLEQQMLESGIESEEWFRTLDKELRAEVRAAAEFADDSDAPEPSLVDAFVYA